MSPARAGWLGWLVIVILLLSLGLFLPGCSTRYLTEEQDAQLREVCERQGGCTVLPTPTWNEIRDILRQLAAPDTKES